MDSPNPYQAPQTVNPAAAGPGADLAAVGAHYRRLGQCGLAFLGGIVVLVGLIVAGLTPPMALLVLVYATCFLVAPLLFLFTSVRFAKAAGRSGLVVGGLTFLFMPLSMPFTWLYARGVMRSLAAGAGR